MKDFWQKLKKPFFVLAPMEDVTDTVFRQIVNSAARPDVFFTEFTNVDGLMSAGRDKLIDRLKFSRTEKPVIAQVWGLKPENYLAVARLVVQMGFAGIDINMGCPQKVVVKTGACAGLMKNRKLAKEIIVATKEGAGTLPISVKTRLGYEAIQTEDWIYFLLEQNLDALTLHGRTVSEMSAKPVHWDEIGKAVRLRDSLSPQTVIIGNGDVIDRVDGLSKAAEFGVDGIMIGRGVFHNLWVFENIKKGKNPDRGREERIAMALSHVRLFKKTWKNQKNPQILKKYLKIYIHGFKGASQLREELMHASNVEELIIKLEKAI